MGFLFLESIVLCSIYNFCAALTENIAVQLRLLFDFFVVIVLYSGCRDWKLPIFGITTTRTVECFSQYILVKIRIFDWFLREKIKIDLFWIFLKPLVYAKYLTHAKYSRHRSFTFDPKFFRGNPHIKITNWRAASLNPGISYVFLLFIAKITPNYSSFNHLNQLHPMGILSHTGGVDPGHSRLASFWATIQLRWIKLRFR